MITNGIRYWVLFIIAALFLFVSCGQKKYKLDEVVGYVGFLDEDEIVYLKSSAEPLDGFLVDDSNRDIGVYVKGKRNGLHYVWLRGIKVEECSYENGVKHGVLRRWWDNGRLHMEASFKHGVMDDMFKTLSEDGILCDSGIYVNGLFTGVKRMRHEIIFNAGHLNLSTGEMGGLSDEIYYENGKIIRSRKWNKYGELTEELNGPN